MLVLLRRASPEYFSSIPFFIQILLPFEYFRICLIFLAVRIMSILRSNFQKFSNLQSLERYSYKYMLRLLYDTVQNIEF